MDLMFVVDVQLGPQDVIASGIDVFRVRIKS